MKKTLIQLFAVCMTFTCMEAGAETLSDYVNTCKQQLGFTSIPNMDCNKGVLFAPNGGAPDETHDYMYYVRVNDTVDAAVACRWINTGLPENNGFYPPPFSFAASVELLVHNRQSGNTCFFSAQERDFVVYDPAIKQSNTIHNQVSTAVVSPTDANASNYWKSPTDLDSKVPCVDCHVAGPYIASPRIAPFLAQFGLLNNGHDTLGLLKDAQGNLVGKYRAVGSTFNHFNNIIATYNSPATCSNGCHNIGSNSTVPDVIGGGNGFTLLPSISSVISEVANADLMPPYNDDSDYRWINLDTPGDGVEAESFANAKMASVPPTPQLLSNCIAPGVMEAHVVGSNNVFMVTQQSNLGLLPDKLSVFNVKDGLVCLNSDQEPGHSCQDYKIRYECTDSSGNKTWTSWYNMDSPSGDGDHEERSKDANVCTSPSGSIATGIEASTTLSNGWTYNSYGPNDRLARFSPYGLTCNNADQPDGQCSNYVVRYSSCSTTPPPPLRTAHLISVYTGKQLTATGTANNALVKGQPLTSGWNTQQWVIEPLQNTEYVRLRNTGTNTYLNVTTQAESATVVTYASNTGYTSEEWIIEPVNNSNDFRLKNLWSGKYLTIADTSTYSAIYSQTLNTGWTSQRWLIQ